LEKKLREKGGGLAQKRRNVTGCIAKGREGATKGKGKRLRRVHRKEKKWPEEEATKEH